MNKGNYAYVLKIGERYFCGITKTKRLKTAWSLAGARVFAPWRLEEIEKVETFLTNKNYKHTKVIIKEAENGIK